MLAKVFYNIHSSNNLSEEARNIREKVKGDNPEITKKCEVTNNCLSKDFSLYELKRAIMSVKETSPGKDEICYSMIGKLSDIALASILKLYNKIWEEGKLPKSWKHSIIVPIVKPGKDRSEATSYRPIALTSNMCKIMERLIVNRLTYEIESKGLFTPYQSGFRKGRTTMDSILCLESEIRKAQTNKEAVIGVFIDVEKAYDML